MTDGIETIRTASANDVAVRKTIETDADDTATVTLEVTAERDGPLAVRLTERALADVPDDDIDLRAGRGAEHWQLEDAAVFERTLDGGESCTVAYRVRNVDEDRFRRLDADPDIRVETDSGVETDVSTVLDGVVDRDGSDAVRRLVEGRADSLTDPRNSDAEAGDVPASPRASDADGTDSAAGAGSTDSTGTVDGADSAGDAGDPGADGVRGPAEAPAAVEPEGTNEEGDAGEAAAPSGSVAAALLEELRAGEVDDGVADELREELAGGKSRDVRIRHLQQRVGDLAAYADMLDSFVDDHGTFEEVFAELLADLESVDGEVSALRSDLEEFSATVDRELDDARAERAELEVGRDDVRDRLRAVEADLRALDDRLDGLESFAEQLSDAFGDVDGDGDT